MMNVRELLSLGRPLYLDGAMGTLLQERGLPAGAPPEEWNLSRPGEITAVHRAYFEAGSDIVCTDTFGANRLKFPPERLGAIIRAAVANALAARTPGKDQFVALDIGPTGRMLVPFGDLDPEEAVSIFSEVVRLGAEAGADLIFIETMTDLHEARAALLAAKEASDLPVFVSCAYTDSGKLLTGASPEAVVTTLAGMGADALGVNCSYGPAALVPVVERYLAASPVPVFFKPNAGLPRDEGGKAVFDLSPEAFAASAAPLFEKGVRLAGGCCGTAPEYIRALAAASRGAAVPAIKKPRSARIASPRRALEFREIPLLIGERINPTGKKRLKEALRSGDFDYLIREAISQEEAGADILDVNVGLPELDEAATLARAVTELQAITDLPLQIDSASPKALEAALRAYCGKALINSVNGKKESMDAVFPLAKKYGGLIVALTLDESGIPETAEGRLAVAGKILAEAKKYGLTEDDLIFDPLAMAVSADDRAAVETLRAVRLITEKLGCRTSLGVSNVSFGLPRREAITAAYLVMAMQNGLSAAIVNPLSGELQRAYRAALALAGKDPSCAGYLAACTEAPPADAPAEGSDDLALCIRQGRKDAAARLTKELLSSRGGMDLIQNEIIPALDEVGRGFEAQTVYLPQLLLSAEAAKAAFEAIRAAMESGAAPRRSPFVLATVKGDIHDIGKNIVKLLLENYGFEVHDLGRDVPPEAIADLTVRLHAPLVGLSALMTTTVPAMAETIRLLRRVAPWTKVVVGGAVLNREYADSIGADFWAKDAMDAVRFAEETEKEFCRP